MWRKQYHKCFPLPSLACQQPHAVVACGGGSPRRRAPQFFATESCWNAYNSTIFATPERCVIAGTRMKRLYIEGGSDGGVRWFAIVRTTATTPLPTSIIILLHPTLETLCALIICHSCSTKICNHLHELCRSYYLT